MSGRGGAAVLDRVAQRSVSLSDAGNAEVFAFRHAFDARFVHGLDRWCLWDGTRFAPDDRRGVYGLAIETARGLHAYASAAATGDEAKAISKHAILSEKRERLEAMLALARTMAPLAVVPDDLDRDPDLLNVQNGTIHLRTGRLLEHAPAHLITKICSVAYDPSASSPAWAGFLERVFPDADVRSYVQRAVGYSLSGRVDEHVLFFCFGTGANGKSTFLETVREMLSESEYARAAAPDLLLAKKQDRHAAELADLRGARFITTIEAGEGRAWDESRVKWLTGGDAISARFMYANPFTFQPTGKFWVAANHRPRVKGTDLGFWRRVHLVPFNVTIPREEQDHELRAKLRRELAGVLRWAVDGAIAWRAGGLRPPPPVVDATQAYRSGEDVLAAFLEERCSESPDARVLVGALYDVFRSWADASGERPMTKRAFGDALEDRGFQRKASNGRRWFVGLALRAEDPSEREE